MNNYWIVKQEPDGYPFSRLEADEVTEWTGVRNYQARNFLKEMQKGDLVLYYHSGSEKNVVGLAVVSRAAFPDPTDENWVAVELKAIRSLTNPVSLNRLRENPQLGGMIFLKQSRLSVASLTEAEFLEIIRMSGD